MRTPVRTAQDDRKGRSGAFDLRPIGAAFIGVLIVLALAASLPSDAVFEGIFREHGPVEWFSALAWVVVAALFGWFAIARKEGLVAWLAVPLYLAAAMREADLHKAFGDHSALKLSFYLSDGFALWQKLVAAAFVLATVVALVTLSLRMLRSLLRAGVRRQSMQLLLVAVAILVVSKVFDRAPAILLEDFGVALPGLALRWLAAFEEGLEALLPAAFLLPFLAARRERRASFSAAGVR